MLLFIVVRFSCLYPKQNPFWSFEVCLRPVHVVWKWLWLLLTFICLSEGVYMGDSENSLISEWVQRISVGVERVLSQLLSHRMNGPLHITFIIPCRYYWRTHSVHYSNDDSGNNWYGLKRTSRVYKPLPMFLQFSKLIVWFGKFSVSF